VICLNYRRILEMSDSRKFNTIVDQELLEAISEREDKFKEAKGNPEKTRELIKEIMESPKVRCAWRNYEEGKRNR
jgi:hypothetical protein